MTTTKTQHAKVIAIASDIHFDLHDVAAWRSFKQWHREIKPWRTILLGDLVDLGMLGKYPQGANDPVYAIEQVKCMVREVNQLAQHSDVTIMSGNHDERWERVVLGAGPALRGALGLTLHDQAKLHGLDKRVKWTREDTKEVGIRIGQFLLRHGHKQSGRFGGGKHLAANRIMKSLGGSEVFGHHHRAQMFCQTADGRTAIALANPCLTGPHEYAGDADWQRGFTILELDAPHFKRATPHIIVMEDGRFSYGGKTYGVGK